MTPSSGQGGKDKGLWSHHRQAGLGRLRRANAKSRTRGGDLTRLDEDDPALERADAGRDSHSGENLLARFNRVARDAASGVGEAGVISGFDGLAILVRTVAGDELPCQIRRVLKKMLFGVKTPLAVGDRVRVGREAGDAVITGIEPRTNQLARADSHNRALVHVAAANLDLLVIVTSLACPDLKTGLIDRYLVLAGYNAITPVIVVNKCDLGDPGPVVALYRSLGYEVFPLVADRGCPNHDPNTICALSRRLAGSACVVAGQSGVGKSSLINALYPGLDARIGAVSQTIGKGRHTTRSARAYPVPGGGRLIDTPGVRECGITGLSVLDVALLYPDIARFHPDCRFHNCSHLHEPECAVRQALDQGHLDPARYESYRSIVQEDLTDGFAT